MSSEAQIRANQQNAQHSTGPVTAEGKSNSSRNALVIGLYTRQDYVKPDERDLYKQFCETIFPELAPENLLEETLTAEITGASWRLRRCSAVEAELAEYPNTTPCSTKSQTKHHPLRRTRPGRRPLPLPPLHQSAPPPANRARLPRSPPSGLRLRGPRRPQQVARSLNASAKQPQENRSKGLSMAEIEALCAPPPCAYEPIDLASFCKPETADVEESAESNEDSAESASFCTDEMAAAPEPRQIPRSAPCPCGSRQKYKRCCGRNAAPVLNRAA